MQNGEIIKVSSGTAVPIELYPDRVSIIFRNKKVDISFDLITAIEFKPKNWSLFASSAGAIIFYAPSLVRTKFSVLAGPIEINDGEVPITNNEEAEAFYTLAKETWSEYKKLKSTSLSSASDIADTLLKYKSLLDSGVITQQEFDTKKKELMG